MTNSQASLSYRSAQDHPGLPMKGKGEKGLNKLKEPENLTICHK